MSYKLTGTETEVRIAGRWHKVAEHVRICGCDLMDDEPVCVCTAADSRIIGVRTVGGGLPMRRAHAVEMGR